MKEQHWYLWTFLYLCFLFFVLPCRYLVKFLTKLAQDSEVNKMTPSNIAIVLGPNLLWAKTEGWEKKEALTEKKNGSTVVRCFKQERCDSHSRSRVSTNRRLLFELTPVGRFVVVQLLLFFSLPGLWLRWLQPLLCTWWPLLSPSSSMLTGSFLGVGPEFSSPAAVFTLTSSPVCVVNSPITHCEGSWYRVPARTENQL